MLAGQRNRVAGVELRIVGPPCGGCGEAQRVDHGLLLAGIGDDGHGAGAADIRSGQIQTAVVVVEREGGLGLRCGIRAGDEEHFLHLFEDFVVRGVILRVVAREGHRLPGLEEVAFAPCGEVRRDDGLHCGCGDHFARAGFQRQRTVLHAAPGQDRQRGAVFGDLHHRVFVLVEFADGDLHASGEDDRSDQSEVLARDGEARQAGDHARDGRNGFGCGLRDLDGLCLETILVGVVEAHGAAPGALRDRDDEQVGAAHEVDPFGESQQVLLLFHLVVSVGELLFGGGCGVGIVHHDGVVTLEFHADDIGQVVGFGGRDDVEFASDGGHGIGFVLEIGIGEQLRIGGEGLFERQRRAGRVASAGEAQFDVAGLGLHGDHDADRRSVAGDFRGFGTSGKDDRRNGVESFAVEGDQFASFGGVGVESVECKSRGIVLLAGDQEQRSGQHRDQQV